jgi:ferrous iron transport protein A
METTLADCVVGEVGEVRGFAQANGRYRKRLLSMGLVRGTRIIVERVAPMGDPVEIRVREYSLSLRRQEAKVLLVEKVDV